MSDEPKPQKHYSQLIFLVVLGGLVLFGWQYLNGRLLAPAPTPVDNSAAVANPAAGATPLPELTPLAFEQTAVSIANLPIRTDASIVPAANPETYQINPPSHQFILHEVQRGETPNIIADKYGISPETLLGGNTWLSKESNALRTGTELVILPVDGVLHTVERGDTLAALAERYQVEVADIIAYTDNNLEFPFRLLPESQLVIPGAVVGFFEVWIPPKSLNGAEEQVWAVVGRGFFDWPVSGRCVSQFYWAGHPGLDVAMAAGSPVLAADRGTITYASWAAGTYFDYGNLIVINHGNGYETLYAHLSGFNVVVGQTVEPGQLIGFTGNTGRSSGPHLHFEIRSFDFQTDPLSSLSGSVQDCT